MMLLLLMLATFVVLCLPLLPALDEWWWPTDIMPLHIDGDDAIDPPYLARRFAQHLQLAIEAGDTHLGKSEIVRIASPGQRWPMDHRETFYCASRRLWRVDGSAELPAGITFLAEVAVEHDAVTAPRGVYRALLAGGRIKLAPRTRVLRWAHADEIQIDRACRLPGRVSAERCLHVGQSVRFGVLHAPEIRFAHDDKPAAATAAPAPVTHTGLPHPEQWVLSAGRGVAGCSIDLLAHHAWRVDLVCRGRLTLGEGCHARGSLKAHGELELGAGCHVADSVFAQGQVRIGSGCVVLGCVVSETAVILEPGCVIGAPGQEVTVSAPHIEVATNVRVHGTLWASAKGRTRSKPSASARRVASALHRSAPRAVA